MKTFHKLIGVALMIWAFTLIAAVIYTGLE